MNAVRRFFSRSLKTSRILHAFGAVAILIGTVALVEHASAQQSMPSGPGEKVFQDTCTQCHGAEMVIGLKMTRDGWASTVDDMIAKGAQAKDDDLKLLIEYLAKNFGDTPSKVNVNHDAAKALQSGLELSDKDAQAIVDYRAKNGDFKTLNDLKKVPGLDAAKIDAKKDQISF